MQVLVFTLIAIAWLAIFPATVSAESTSESAITLRKLADSRGVLIGASVDEDALREDGDYADLLGREFSALTPENSMKFDSLHATPFGYSFDAGDRVLGFAEVHGMQLHGHVLVWHEQLPEWLTKTDWMRGQLRNILREHIFRVVGRYRGRIKTWDVVSEAIDENGELRKTFWLKGIGPEYIDLAFQWAHEADPDAHLLYNDYGGEGMGRKANGIFRLMEDLRRRGVPIHGVGLQMHLRADEAPSPTEVRANMSRLAALGLMVHVTEMDVSVAMPVTPAKLAVQADIYRDMMRSCLLASNCRSFTLWGFTDRYSWIPEFFPGRGAALIFDEQMRAKPSYDALIETLSGH